MNLLHADLKKLFGDSLPSAAQQKAVYLDKYLKAADAADIFTAKRLAAEALDELFDLKSFQTDYDDFISEVSASDEIEFCAPKDAGDGEGAFGVINRTEANYRELYDRSIDDEDEESANQATKAIIKLKAFRKRLLAIEEMLADFNDQKRSLRHSSPSEPQKSASDEELPRAEPIMREEAPQEAEPLDFDAPQEAEPMELDLDIEEIFPAMTPPQYEAEPSEADLPEIDEPIEYEEIEEITEASALKAAFVPDKQLSEVIESKLWLLSESGYRFSPQQLSALCAEPSEEDSPLPCAFAVRLEEGEDEFDSAQYYPRIFEFGTQRLRFCNLWNGDNIEYFDSWFDSLTDSLDDEPPTESEPDFFIFKAAEPDFTELPETEEAPPDVFVFTKEEAAPESAAEAEPETSSEPLPEPIIEAASDAGIKPELIISSAPELVDEPEAEPVSEPEAEPEPEPIAEPEPIVEPEPLVEPEPIVEPEPMPEAPPTNKYLGLNLLGTQYEAEDYAGIYVQLCEAMILRKPYVMAALDVLKFDLEKDANFSYLKSDIKTAPIRLSNGLWIETARTPEQIEKLCGDILRVCGYSRSVFSITEEERPPLPLTNAQEMQEE